MEHSVQNTFSALLSPEDTILFASVSAKSFGEIIECASQSLHTSIIVADSLHYILALSPDILQLCGSSATWVDLVNAGFVPAVMPERQSNTLDVFPSSEPVCQSLIFHNELPTSTYRCCTMCDIVEDGATLLKLAISADTPLTEAQKKSVLVLANAIHLAYFKLGTSSATDNRGRFLLSLLHRREPLALPYTGLNGFDLTGSFQLACFETQLLGYHNFSFTSAFSELSHSSQYLTALDGDMYTILMHPGKTSAVLLKRLHQFALERSFPIALSSPFYDLKYTRNRCVEAYATARLAARFCGASGIQHYDDYALFLMFEQLQSQKGVKQYSHPAASLLSDYDEEKNTEYVQTLFCWLLHGQHAPSTASALFIHRNTLDKRLKKIDTLIHPDWQNVAYTFRLLYSLYVTLSKKNQLTFFPSANHTTISTADA